jgi:hypothetical protein
MVLGKTDKEKIRNTGKGKGKGGFGEGYGIRDSYVVEMVEGGEFWEGRGWVDEEVKGLRYSGYWLQSSWKH